MLIPQIEFRYSAIYDGLFQESFQDKNDSYPTPEDIHTFIKKLTNLWFKYESVILKTLVNITQLEWKEDKIICYVVGRAIAFSDPLTIPAHIGYEDYAIDMITHELIHRLFMQEGNYGIIKLFWDRLEKAYKSLSDNARGHIPVEAVHTKLYKTFFNDKRLKRDRDFLSEMEDYKMAWEIVEKEGYETIIKNLLEERN